MKELKNAELRSIDGGATVLRKGEYKCRCGKKCSSASAFMTHIGPYYKSYNVISGHNYATTTAGKATVTYKTKNNGKTREVKLKLNGKLVRSASWKVWGAECVYPDSEILVSLDGKTKLAKDMKENDKIVYFDYHNKVQKEGSVEKVYVHEKATNFVKYVFEDNTVLKVTDYHPIFTKNGWKSATNRNGYAKPEVGDEVKTKDGWKKLVEIEEFNDEVDCYDFSIKAGADNYFANNTLVQNSIVEQQIYVAHEMASKK